MSEYIVKHKKLMLMVDGKIQHVPSGSSITMTEKAAEKHLVTGKIESLKDAKKVSVGKKEEDTTSTPADPSKDNKQSSK